MSAALGYGMATAVLVIAAQSSLISFAHAQETYPSKAIRLIVPSQPGGGTDAAARIVAPKRLERLAQPIVIDYRPGAAAMIVRAVASVPR